MENNKVMSKILVCLYVIIALLSVNTLILILANVDASEKKESSSEEEQGTYDVSMFEEITTDDIDKVKDTDGIQVIYIGRSNCGYCLAFLPTLQNAQEEYAYKTKYLDINKITTEEKQQQLLELDNEDKLIETDFWATPKVLIVKDGKLVDSHVGYSDYDTFADFLEENGITK